MFSSLEKQLHQAMGKEADLFERRSDCIGYSVSNWGHMRSLAVFFHVNLARLSGDADSVTVEQEPRSASPSAVLVVALTAVPNHGFL